MSTGTKDDLLWKCLSSFFENTTREIVGGRTTYTYDNGSFSKATRRSSSASIVTISWYYKRWSLMGSFTTRTNPSDLLEKSENN